MPVMDFVVAAIEEQLAGSSGFRQATRNAGGGVVAERGCDRHRDV
jgi:hypothetical protein